MHKQQCSDFAKMLAIKVSPSLAEALKKYRSATLKILDSD
jgi:hypothetical protein